MAKESGIGLEQESGLAGQLVLWLERPSPVGKDAGFGQQVATLAPQADGTFVCSAVEPGDYLLVLGHTRGGHSIASFNPLLACEAIRIAPGTQHVRTVVPRLHTVEPRYGGTESSAYASLAPSAPDTVTAARVGAPGVSVLTEGVARLEHVPAGDYTARMLGASGKVSTRLITVPCGEVVVGGE